MNAEGGASGTGRVWYASAILEMLENEIYTERRVFNKRKFHRDRKTGRRVHTMRPSSEWLVNERPDLGIVDRATFGAAPIRPGIEPNMGNDAETYTLSGMVVCRVCGHPFVALRSKNAKGEYIYYGCGGRAAGTGCANRFRFREDIVVLAIVREITQRLLAAGRIERIKAKITERAAERIAESARTRESIRLQLDDVRKRSAAVADLIVSAKIEGRLAADLWKEQLEDLETRRRHLEEQRDQLAAAMKDDHSRLGRLIDQAVQEYRDGLVRAEDPAAIREALRRLCGPSKRIPTTT